MLYVARLLTGQDTMPYKELNRLIWVLENWGYFCWVREDLGVELKGQLCGTIVSENYRREIKIAAF